MKKLRKALYIIMEAAADRRSASWYFDIFLVALISLNVLAIILESVESISSKYQVLFERFELFSVIFFSLEYVIRIWTSVESKKYKKAFSGRIRFMLTPLAIIDLLAVLPFYLAFFIDLRFVRILRFFRLFRLFKIARYTRTISIIEKVFKAKKDQLIMSTIFLLFMLLLTSCLMYYIENDAQPEAFSSIPETMWWGVATLTTVGYGDVYPITPLGKILGGMIAILGIGLFALPTGILASGFSAALEKGAEVEEDKCPTCGK